MEGPVMMYPFLTLNDETEITHSEMKNDGSVKIYIEKPDEKDGFHYATIYIPSFRWENVYKFSDSELSDYEDIIKRSQSCILQFAQEGGFDNASTVPNG